MAIKTISSFFSNLFLLLLHFGCFIYATPRPDSDPQRFRKKRKACVQPANFISSSWYFIRRVFSGKQPRVEDTHTATSPRSSRHSTVIPLDTLILEPPRKRRSESRSESDSLSDNPFLPLRNDIFPCPTCGEIFPRPLLLEQHRATKHAVSELHDGDPSKNVVWIIFNTGWPDKGRAPRIHRILKIHNSQKTLARFEEYREIVMSRAAVRNDAVIRRNERCLADGNELLRFHCTTFVCALGQNGNSALCGHHYCSVCGIIRAGFSPKLDGISTLATSWNAHLAVPDDVEAEFSFMCVKRAMLVCRVVAGRVGYEQVAVEKGNPSFDSVKSSSGELIGKGNGKSDDEELLVFNPRAVLPCFVIVYSV